ncbi:PAS domain-containing protein [Anaerobacillus sp. HL2]|nr:PAS domain-containing protein [Anaerobacillus sp. HL2]
MVSNIFNTISSAIIITNPEGIITSINKSAEKMFEISKFDWIGKSIMLNQRIHLKVLKKQEKINSRKLCFEIDKSKRF